MTQIYALVSTHVCSFILSLSPVQPPPTSVGEEKSDERGLLFTEVTTEKGREKAVKDDIEISVLEKSPPLPLNVSPTPHPIYWNLFWVLLEATEEQTEFCGFLLLDCLPLSPLPSRQDRIRKEGRENRTPTHTCNMYVLQASSNSTYIVHSTKIVYSPYLRA